MRYISLLMFLLFPVAMWAQGSPTPQVTADVPTEEVIVGQPIIVRIKVLVPTFLPSPPVFPSLEQENLLVHLPERASGPISETVSGETWSGVQRSYRLYSLIPGQMDLGAQNITVTFADPETNEPMQATISLPSITLNAVVPDGAQGLDPLIIATGFELTQEVEGSTEMQTGGAITRRLTAQISGTTPILVPALIPESQDLLLRPYPKEPRFTETEDRGILSGQRVDEVVYLAQDGGQTQLPAISVDWYNLTTGLVETAAIDPVELVLAPPKRQPPSAEIIIKAISWVAILGLVLWTSLRWGMPRYRAWRDARVGKYRASAEFAIRELRNALQQHDLSGAYTALEAWKARSGLNSGAGILEERLAQIGATKYSASDTGTAADWSAAVAALKILGQSHHKQDQPLPPLNP